MQPDISVIICTHNPCSDYLDRVLHSLKIQTLPMQNWELLFIDNASNRDLSQEVDLSWHPNACHLREEQLGLTPARLRGIRQSQTEILIFVDDDNVLDSDYLEAALTISKDYPLIGAWGGRIRPEFEVEPPEWTRRYWIILAIREFDRDKWSNLPDVNETTPCGAGLCIRKSVALQYMKNVSGQTNRLNLGRKGEQLTACEDSDLALTACDMGLGTGQFTALNLIHLIPSRRLQRDYLEKLEEGLNYSITMFNFLRSGEIPKRRSWLGELYQYYLRWRMKPNDRYMFDASRRGFYNALREISTL